MCVTCWGARYLIGENPKVAWAKFSASSLAVLLQSNISNGKQAAIAIVNKSPQVLSCQLKIVHGYVYEYVICVCIYVHVSYIPHILMSYSLKVCMQIYVISVVLNIIYKFHKRTLWAQQKNKLGCFPLTRLCSLV
jgi:hypothetical protein